MRTDAAVCHRGADATHLSAGTGVMDESRRIRWSRSVPQHRQRDADMDIWCGREDNRLSEWAMRGCLVCGKKEENEWVCVRVCGGDQPSRAPADRDGEVWGRRRGMEMSGERRGWGGSTRCGPELMTAGEKGEETDAIVTRGEGEGAEEEWKDWWDWPRNTITVKQLLSVVNVFQGGNNFGKRRICFCSTRVTFLSTRG